MGKNTNKSYKKGDEVGILLDLSEVADLFDSKTIDFLTKTRKDYPRLKVLYPTDDNKEFCLAESGTDEPICGEGFECDNIYYFDMDVLVSRSSRIVRVSTKYGWEITVLTTLTEREILTIAREEDVCAKEMILKLSMFATKHDLECSEVYVENISI